MFHKRFNHIATLVQILFLIIEVFGKEVCLVYVFVRCPQNYRVVRLMFRIWSLSIIVCVRLKVFQIDCDLRTASNTCEIARPQKRLIQILEERQSGTL